MASQDEMLAQNRNMRALALAMFPSNRKYLGSFSSVGTSTAGGGSARVKLYNVGLGTSLLIEVVANVTIGSHATSLASPKAPWNIVDKIKLTDYDGTDRINTTGYSMYLVNRRREAELGKCITGRAEANFDSLTAVAGSNTIIQPNFYHPATPIATGTVDIKLMMQLPLAYDPDSDLRGAVLMQTALGEMYLNLDFNPVFQAVSGVDSVFTTDTGSTVTVNSISVNVWQDYLLLQSIGGATPLPQLDLLTVYEINTLRTTDNIAVGAEKLISYPNVRSVKSLMWYYVNNGAMATGDGSISRFRLIVNGNNILQDNTARSQLFNQRYFLNGRDLPPSTYLMNHSKKPIETAAYGNVQLGVTPSAYTAGTTYMEPTFENFYTKGSVLPGIPQGS